MDRLRDLETLASVGGVVTLGELRTLYAHLSEAGVLKRARALCQSGDLIKIKAGLYATPGTPLARVSYKLNPESYVTSGTVLAKHLLIGSIPGRFLEAVKVGRPRIFRSALGTIEHVSIKPSLFFGFDFVDGFLQATPEKAFLDACYYAQRGRRTPFDLGSDIELARLDHVLLDRYLQHYDPRFVRFVRSLVDHV